GHQRCGNHEHPEAGDRQLRADGLGQRGRDRDRGRRRHRPDLRAPRGHGRRAAGVRERHDGPGVQPGRGEHRGRHLRRLPPAQGGRHRPGDRPAAGGAGRRRGDRAGREPAGAAAGRRPGHPVERDPQAGHRRPRHRRPPAGHRAAPDRHQGDRLDDPDRPRPAGADHRRP
ncbi:MAG: ATP synthase alpha chain, partial [uncultured Phycisphaerae bacterium]